MFCMCFWDFQRTPIPRCLRTHLKASPEPPWPDIGERWEQLDAGSNQCNHKVLREACTFAALNSHACGRHCLWVWETASHRLSPTYRWAPAHIHSEWHIDVLRRLVGDLWLMTSDAVLSRQHLYLCVEQCRVYSRERGVPSRFVQASCMLEHSVTSSSKRSWPPAWLSVSTTASLVQLSLQVNYLVLFLTWWIKPGQKKKNDSVCSESESEWV